MPEIHVDFDEAYPVFYLSKHEYDTKIKVSKKFLERMELISTAYDGMQNILERKFDKQRKKEGIVNQRTEFR